MMELIRMKMETSPLPAAPVFDPEPEVSTDLVVLGKEAEELLKYHALGQEVNSPHRIWEHKRFSMDYHWQQVCKRVVTENHLAEVLAELEIDILDLESVNRYKEAHLQELMKPKHTGRFAWFLNSLEPSENYVWRRVSLQNYKSLIPPYVINKAVQIKKRLPKAVFWVEECVDSNTARVEDPFLIVDYDGEFYVEGEVYRNSVDIQYKHIERYIEVWGEQKFKAGI